MCHNARKYSRPRHGELAASHGIDKVCTADAGWDGPTGLGSPNGLAPFE